MAAIVRHPTITITWLNGGTDVPITRVLTAHTVLGLDISVGEATFSVPEMSDLNGATYFSMVTISLSAGGTVQDWEGYIVEFDNSLYPREVGVICKGRLVLAELTQMKAYTAGGGTAPDKGGLLLVPADKSGRADDTIIVNVLTACGISTSVSIAGTGHVLGTVALDPFRWAEGESGLSVIQRFDEMCAFQPGGVGPWYGFRTFDDVNGVVRRKVIDTVPGGTPAYTFHEGEDIFSGSSQRNILQAKNKIVVVGYDPSGTAGPVNYTLAAANANIPTPPQYLALHISNPMIERQTEADPGSGISCEAVANCKLRAWNVTMEQSTFTTPLDVPIDVGSTIAIATPSTVPERLGIVGAVFVQRVERDIAAETGFQQILTVLYGSS